jgi:hypothetical protein
MALRLTIAFSDNPRLDPLRDGAVKPRRDIRTTALGCADRRCRGSRKGTTPRAGGTLPATGNYPLVLGTSWGGGENHVRIKLY